MGFRAFDVKYRSGGCSFINVEGFDNVLRDQTCIREASAPSLFRLRCMDWVL